MAFLRDCCALYRFSQRSGDNLNRRARGQFALAAWVIELTLTGVRLARRDLLCSIPVRNQQRAYSRIEAPLGFDICDLAANGEQASRLAMNNQPDVVLMDINLEGGREGIEVARWLRNVCDAPIVFVTGYTDRDTVERIHEQVPNAPVLSKPLYGDRLADAVAAVTHH